MSCNEGPGKQRSDEIIALLHENDALRVKCADWESQLAVQRALNYDLSLLCEDLRKEAKGTKADLLECQMRCADAEDRLHFTEAGNDVRKWECIIEERDALIKKNEWLQKKLDFAHAQLEIVFRIFPDPDRYCNM